MHYYNQWITCLPAVIILDGSFIDIKLFSGTFSVGVTKLSSTCSGVSTNS